MIRNSTHQQYEPEHPREGTNTVDYSWFREQFVGLLERLGELENAVTAIEQCVTTADSPAKQAPDRQFYSVQEFAKQVERGEYTVREWCRMARINAEKCESGRGEAKNWKIPAEELTRYRDHGLLPASYLC